MKPKTTKPTVRISVSYRSLDHYSETRSFRTLNGAQKYAQKWVGAHPDLGSFYAVSNDGVGRITVKGCTLAELFPAETSSEEGHKYWCECLREDSMLDCNCKGGTYQATEPEAPV